MGNTICFGWSKSNSSSVSGKLEKLFTMSFRVAEPFAITSRFARSELESGFLYTAISDQNRNVHGRKLDMANIDINTINLVWECIPLDITVKPVIEITPVIEMSVGRQLQIGSAGTSVTDSTGYVGTAPLLLCHFSEKILKLKNSFQKSTHLKSLKSIKQLIDS